MGEGAPQDFNIVIVHEVSVEIFRGANGASLKMTQCFTI